MKPKPKRNNGWWNLDEKKPKDHQECLILTKNGCMVEAQWTKDPWEDEGDFDHWDCWQIPHPATHWKPRPKLPNRETE